MTVEYSRPAPISWGVSSTPTKAAENKPGQLGKDDFLKLLITQLKYQDPTNPMDNQEFIAQMASFSALEQMTNLNTGFTNLADSINNRLVPGFMLQQSSQMIGRQVSYLSPTTNPDGSTSYETLYGIIQSVVMKEGVPYYVINGQEVAVSDITQLGDKLPTVGDQILLDILDALVQQSGNLIGKTVSYLSPVTNPDGTTDTETKSGVIQSVIMKEGIPYYVIDGQEVEAGNITKIEPGGLNDQVLAQILNALQELRELLESQRG